jgi:isopentenyl diphosphate isomerase/L-lactate dehydrogenase-like FMN-dependent dehydrogenase
VFVLVIAARVVVAYGITGVLVSTHGGRHMGATLSAITSVPEMGEICQGHPEGSLDSGRRRGSDVCKA